jgi:hypothetical protein
MNHSHIFRSPVSVTFLVVGLWRRKFSRQNLQKLAKFRSRTDFLPQTYKNPWPESASQLHRPRDSRLSAKLVLTFADRRCCMVNVTDSYGRIPFSRPEPLLFLSSSSSIVLTSRSGPLSNPLLRKSGSAGNRTRTFGYVARSNESCLKLQIKNLYLILSLFYIDNKWKPYYLHSCRFQIQWSANFKFVSFLLFLLLILRLTASVV